MFSYYRICSLTVEWVPYKQFNGRQEEGSGGGEEGKRGRGRRGGEERRKGGEENLVNPKL